MGEGSIRRVAVTELHKTDVRMRLNDYMVQTANDVYAELDGWQTANRAFQQLQHKLPGFTPEITLLKVASINALYSTNLYAIERMSKHICKMLSKCDLKSTGPELVDEIAKLPVAQPDQEQRHHVSFASKFCHFFISADRYPILDTLAEWTLKKHFKRGKVKLRRGSYYQDFVNAFNHLRTVSECDSTPAEIDHYLWLTGSYFKWKKGQQINTEVSNYFKSEKSKQFRSLVEAEFKGVV